MLAALLAMNLSAADEKKPPLAGAWTWTFTSPDGGQVTPRLKFANKDGEWSGTTSFRAGTETRLKNVTFKDDVVDFDVVRDYLEEKVTTHYNGKVSGTSIKGKITSSANGETQTYDWEAKRISGIDGTWKWSVSFNGRTFESRVTLKLEGEKLSGKVLGGREPLDIHRGSLRNNHVHFETERRGGDGEKTTNVYRGTLEGDKITGTYISNFGGRRTNEWNAARAD